MAYTSPLSGVLDRIGNIALVSMEDLNDDGEWIQLWSDSLTDADLYRALVKKWGKTAGYINKFALIYCHTGDDSGVWLHYLSTQELRTEYRVGCFALPSWD